MNEKQSSITSPIDFRVMRDRFAEETKPLIYMKAKIYSLHVPNIILHGDGTMESKYIFSAETAKTIGLIDEQIEQIRLRIFGA